MMDEFKQSDATNKTGDSYFEQFYKFHFRLLERPFSLPFDQVALYCLLLDRIKYSAMNRHRYTCKETGELYCVFTNEEIQQRFNMSNKTAGELLKRVEENGLITVSRTKRSNRIFVKPLDILLKEKGVHDAPRGFDYDSQYNEEKGEWY